MNKQLKQNLISLRNRFEDEKDYEEFSDYQKLIINFLNHYKLLDIKVSRNIYDDFVIRFSHRNIQSIWRVMRDKIVCETLFS